MRYIYLTEELDKHNIVGNMRGLVTTNIYKLSTSLPLLIYSSKAIKVIASLGNTPLEDMIYTENIPEDYFVLHSHSNTSGRVMVLSDDACRFEILLPRDNNAVQYKSELEYALISTLRELGVKAYSKGNDIIFNDGSYDKKCAGSIILDLGQYYSVRNILDFSIDTSLMDRLYKFDNIKFINKGSFNSMSEIVGGIREIIPEVDREEFTSSVITKFFVGIKEEPELSSFTDEEWNYIMTEASKLVM